MNLHRYSRHCVVVRAPPMRLAPHPGQGETAGRPDHPAQMDKGTSGPSQRQRKRRDADPPVLAAAQAEGLPPVHRVRGSTNQGGADL